MNSTTVSSFAPLEYYKKLTNCLASRKNLRLNLSRIHGAKNEVKSNIPFTTRKIQNKFLSKYNQKQQSGEKDEVQNDAIFKIKQNNDNPAEKGKRNKKDDESFINLPESFFKQHPAPDLSIFKLPAVPPVKKQKLCAESIATTNFTMTSLFSGKFNPPHCSTPMDAPKNDAHNNLEPIIADPKELLDPIEESQEEKRAAEEEQEANEKLIKTAKEEIIKLYLLYIYAVYEASKYLDEIIFGKFDPTEEILKRLKSMFDASTQSPRKSLMSTLNISPEPIEVKEVKNSWPVPVFYDNADKEDDIKLFLDDDPNDCGFSVSIFDDNNSFLDFLNDADPLAFELPWTPAKEQSEPSEHFLYDIPNVWSPSSSFEDEFPVYPEKKDNKWSVRSDINWLEKAFDSQIDMSWETDSECSITPVKCDKKFSNDFSAIFRSPPKSSHWNIEESFSRVISRPKIFKNDLEKKGFDDCPKNISWWSGEDIKSNMSSSLFGKTPKIFDYNFNLF